jgi:hypothetical protein
MDRIASKYASLTQEYLNYAEELSFIDELPSRISILTNGLTVIHRVFEYIILKQQSLDKAYYLSKQAYYYYLEYMQQVYNSNLSKDLNCVDAILFSFKKTIFDANPEYINNVTNMITLNESPIDLSKEDLPGLLDILQKIENLVLYWENPSNNRIKCMDIYFDKFYKLYNVRRPVFDFVTKNLEMIQKKTELSAEEYQDLLAEFFIKTDNPKLSLPSVTDDFLLKYCIDDAIWKQKIHCEKKRMFIDWMFT